MQISIASLCRGRGMIFIGLSVRNLPATHALRFTSKDASGNELPCMFYPADESQKDFQYVVVIPILTIAQTIVGEALDSSGNAITQWTHTFSRFKTTWESRLNYRLKPHTVSQLRDYDKRFCYERITFTPWCILPDAHEHIFRATVSIPSELEYKDLTFTCLNENGQRVAIEPVFLGQKESSPVKFSSFTSKDISVSFRIPQVAENYCFTCVATTKPEVHGFGVLERAHYTEMLESSYRYFQSAQGDPSYDEWFRETRITPADLSLQKHVSFSQKPLFSIVVPLYQTPLNFLHDMVGSVRSQSYENWELLLINASPESTELRSAVDAYLASDPRIKHIELDSNRGISENTNEGLKRAQGDFICFFDHDDILEPNLLFEYVGALNTHDDIDLMYCDEDKLNESGVYFDPFFKPNFNLDLLRNNNYICHLLCIRKTLIDEIGFLDPLCDGAQDHDMTLRAIEKARRVHHVDKILYHWRISSGSTASNPESKSYATDAGIRAVTKHLERVGINAEVEQSRRPFTYKITYPVPADNPLVSIIIPNKDSASFLKTCIDSILQKSSYQNFEIIIVENNSTTDETFEYYAELERHDNIRIIEYKKPFNFSAITNFGVSHAQGAYYLFLNNDTEVISPDWIERMLGICARKDVGVVGVKLFFPDNTIQHAGVSVTLPAVGSPHTFIPRDNWGYFSLNDAEQNFSAVTAACMMTKKEAFEKVAGFTEKLTVAFNDIDYCLKLRDQDYLVVYTPEVQLYHYESLSRGKDDTSEKALRAEQETAFMRDTWAKYYVYGDPYFNRNFDQHIPGSQYFKLDNKH